MSGRSSNPDRNLSLELRFSNGHVEIVNILISSGDNKDKARNDGVTPLLIAAWKGHIEIVQRYSLRCGADYKKKWLQYDS